MSILLVKPKILNTEKKKELKEAGYLIIETNDFENIKVLDEIEIIKPRIILESALQALEWGNDSTCRNAFGKLYREKIMKELKIKSLNDAK